MALLHAGSGELLDVRPLGAALSNAQTYTLVPGPPLEVFRMILLAGKGIPSHHVNGPLTIQCIEGLVELELPGRLHTMQAGDLVYLDPGAAHGLRAVQDSSILVTLLRMHSAPLTPPP